MLTHVSNIVICCLYEIVTGQDSLGFYLIPEFLRSNYKITQTNRVVKKAGGSMQCTSSLVVPYGVH